MDQQDSFAELAARRRSGDQGAATEVFRRFASRLVSLARTELDARLRRKEDPGNLVQSVDRSFFNRYRAGQFEFATWDALCSLLTVITVRKCLDRTDYYLPSAAAWRARPSCRLGAQACGMCEAVDREPTPLEAAVLAETIEQMMRGLEADDRAMIELSLRGYARAYAPDFPGFSVFFDPEWGRRWTV